jgi:hypothetical protein
MTPTEIAGHPESRLGGALLWMMIACTVAVVVPALGVVSAIVVIATGGIHANPRNIFSWLDGPYRLGKVYMIPVAFFMAWSAVFVVMTLARLKPTPIVASVGIVVWATLRIVFSYLGSVPIAAGAENTTLVDALVRMWPYAVAVLAEVALVASFCGYMATGLRPNAYYRRRLPVS